MKLTPLYHTHLELGAEMFTTAAGYEMPAKYSTAEEEHQAVRERVGMNDLCLMGRLDIQGQEAIPLIQSLIVNDAARLSNGQLLYSAMCDERGMVIDDITVLRFGPEHIRVITSSIFRARTHAWITEHIKGRQAYLTDVSSGLGMISVQGPLSRELLQGVSDIEFSDLGFFRFAFGKLGIIPCLIVRVSFSGELGYECYVSTEDTAATWDLLMEAGRPLGLLPYGFDAFDTLRWEKGFIFYGFDATDKNNPYECRLADWIRYDKGDFIGREALLKIEKQGVANKLMGLEVAGETVAAAKQPLKIGEQVVGETVAGFFGPTVGKNLAYAYVDSKMAPEGTEASLKIGGADTLVTVVEMPFYDPKGKRMRM